MKMVNLKIPRTWAWTILTNLEEDLGAGLEDRVLIRRYKAICKNISKKLGICPGCKHTVRAEYLEEGLCAVCNGGEDEVW